MDAPTREHKEIESMRENGETKSVEDISHSKQSEISNTIKELFNEAVTEYEKNTDVELQKITVCGSFASGKAIEYISDLDIRLVVSTRVSNPEEITEYIKVEYDTTKDDIFGFIDTQCHTSDSSDPNAVTIWEK